MKKSISLLLAGLLAGTVCADTNWKAWVRPAETVAEGENASFTAEAKKKTGFSTRIKLENGNFYKVSFRLTFPGDAPASFKYGFYSPDLPLAFQEAPLAKGTAAPEFYLYANKDSELWFRLYFTAQNQLKGTFSCPVIKKLSAEDVKKVVLDEHSDILSNWFIPGWMQKAGLKLETVDAADHIDEGKALKLTVPENYNRPDNAAIRSSALPLLPDTNYKITVWIKGNSTGTVSSIGVDSWIGGGVKHYYAGGGVSVSTEWKKVQIKFRTPSLKEHPQLDYRVTRAKLGFRPNGGLTEVQFKEFTLEQEK